jgi:hypothetical protein
LRSIRGATYSLILLGLSLSVLGADPFVGTWKLNVEKTKVITGLAPKEGTAVYAAQGADYAATFTGIYGSGQHHADRDIEPIGGGILKYTEGGPPAGVSKIVKRVNGTTRVYTETQEGKVIVTTQMIVSKDGRTITAHQKGKDQNGKPYDRIEAWERQ